MKKILIKCITILLAAATLTGCAAERTTIAYTVYPIGFLVNRLTGGSVAAESVQEDAIVQRAVVKSDWKDIVSRAQVFMHIGQLEPYYGMYSSDFTSLVPDQVDLSVLNAVYDFQRYTEVETDGKNTYLESPYYRGDEFSMIDTDTRDLYLWIDPIAMLSMAKDIRAWLTATYPDERMLIEENFETLENDLINLDAQYQALSTSNQVNHKQIRFVSMTASFGNWQKTYGFQVYPVILSKYGALPNEKQLALIEKRIQEDGVKFIVYEENMTEDMVELFNRVEEDLSLTRVELSNLSSLTPGDIDSGKDYLSIMYENLAVLETMAVAVNPEEETSAETAEAADTVEKASADAEPSETEGTEVTTG